MSLLGLLASTEKMVPLGRLHIQPLQWHLKRHWHVPMSLNRSIPWTPQAKKAAAWWVDPDNVLIRSPLHPKDHEVLLFTDASNEGWGCQLGDLSVSGLWSETEKHLHINLLELKAVLLSLKHFRDQCSRQEVMVASDNTSVVAYINNRGVPDRATCTLYSGS